MKWHNSFDAKGESNKFKSRHTGSILVKVQKYFHKIRNQKKCKMEKIPKYISVILHACSILGFSAVFTFAVYIYHAFQMVPVMCRN